MQTFMPYSDFDMTAKCLDIKRLGKQRVEAMQILKTLVAGANSHRGWQNHPAVKMWKGYEKALAIYGIACCCEWMRRGYNDSCKAKIVGLVNNNFLEVVMPPWLGNVEFHRSHQSNLKRKKPEHYKFNVPSDLEYVWPVGVL